ncbi:MAG: PQQ-binding-like beta-propeller repeat protein [Planctomycetes bacterium]|nr:PQQ-binding-like beta-propeller repeat protein [Planctomycetota bacterium]
MHKPTRAYWRAIPLLLLYASSAFSAESTIGWRNDGSGKFPTADPPTTWGRVSKAVKGLRYQADKPKDAGPGDSKAMAGGVALEWLVTGPVPQLESAKTAKDDTVPDEAALDPAEGDKLSATAWKKIALDSACLDIASYLGKPGAVAAFACTHIYSDTGGNFRLQFTHNNGARLMVNGKEAYQQAQASGVRLKIALAKGWNRILVKVLPPGSWKIPAGQGGSPMANLVFYGAPPCEYETTNIAWSTAIPNTYTYFGSASGVGQPIVVKDRVFLLGEVHDLYCLNKADGKILWIRPNGYFEAATDEDKKNPAFKEAEPIAAKLEALRAVILSGAGPIPRAKLDEKIKLEGELYGAMAKVDSKRFKRSGVDVGNAGYAPVSDGRNVYVWFASGVTACYDLDGKCVWMRCENVPSFEHGYSSSPVLVDGKLIVYMRDLIAFDAKTGDVAWRTPLTKHEGANPEGYFHGTPQPVNIGGTALLMLGNGTVVRASDGKVLSTDPRTGKQVICSPIFDRGALFLTTIWPSQVLEYTLPAAVSDPFKFASQKTRPIPTSQFPFFYLDWHMSSPLIHDGLMYLLNNSGVLSVYDLEKDALVYQRMLDLDHFQAHNESAARGIGVSPALAGNHLYFFGNSGACVVLEPGRQYKEVAKNRIEAVAEEGTWGERQERSVANPFFDGKRLYFRGESTLYAIEKK